MATGATLDRRGAPTPEACRRFFHERGDVSLGLVPQLLLEPDRADLWAYFWYAARIVDDEIEKGQATGNDYRQRLRNLKPDTAHEAALERFLGDLPPSFDRHEVVQDLDRALAALDHEQAFRQPPPLAEYIAVVHAKAGVPLHLLNQLLLPGADEETLARFSLLLAVSIQLGDDVRDRARDLARGHHTFTREEIDGATRERPDDTDPAATLVPTWRESVCKVLAIQALERAEAFRDAHHRGLARLEAQLWLRAIEAGQVRASRHPVRWPAPLGDLLEQGAPSLARMAAARHVLHDESERVAPGAKWDARRRADELQRVRVFLPPLYEALEAAVRG